MVGHWTEPNFRVGANPSKRASGRVGDLHLNENFLSGFYLAEFAIKHYVCTAKCSGFTTYTYVLLHKWLRYFYAPTCSGYNTYVRRNVVQFRTD